MPSHINVFLAAAVVIGFTLILASRYQFNASSYFQTGPPPESEEKNSWNQLYHLGGESPWIQRVDDVVSTDVEPPSGCSMQQVHLLSRHGERYPTASSGQKMLNLIDRLKEYGDSIGGLKGDLAFLNEWNYFTHEFEKLVGDGPYAGTLQAFTTGVKLRTRYGNLIPDTEVRFWASNSSRVIETARYFAGGFFRLDWKDGDADLKIISEDPGLGGDTLTPTETCNAFNNDTENGHDHGQDMLDRWGAAYLPVIAKRFNTANRGANITAEEVYSMQEMCGFGIIATGSSPWCNAFTEDEWLSFEYARDLLHYYRTGYGNKYGPAIGWQWLDATRNLLLAGPGNGTLFFSFTHDTTLMATITALGTFKVDKKLSAAKRVDSRYWKTSQTGPMGGRLILERLYCPNAEAKDHTPPKTVFIRANINDGIVPIPGCNNGPGHSCPLDKFSDWITSQGKDAGDFGSVCGLSKDAPKKITFLQQPSSK